MNKKSILLAYATRFGSTQEVAEVIVAELRNSGLEVDLQPMQEVQGLDGYEAVVLGAAIYNARWHQNAQQFVVKHREALEQRPVAIFALGPLGTSQAAMLRSRQQLEKELEMYPWMKSAAVEMFAGKFDPKKPGMGLIYKLLPTRDYRDWEAIHAWAKALPEHLEHAEMLQPA
jgi:menaquinone-dependent protoporphyrinogen oxidase